jgi:rhodanese-related sulfurtransferase
VDEARIVDAAEALVLVEAGVPFVDVRPRTAFEHGHVPGARSLAFEHFRPHRLAELVHPVEPFVLYGAGEMDSRGAVCTLRAASWGFAEARFFRGGFAAWRAVGGAVERAGMAPRRDLA